MLAPGITGFMGGLSYSMPCYRRTVATAIATSVATKQALIATSPLMYTDPNEMLMFIEIRSLLIDIVSGIAKLMIVVLTYR